MRISRVVGLTAALALVAGTVACSTPSSDSSGTADDSEAFATIEHAYGTTIIPEKPERVASVAWMNHEVPLAFGIVPVGMAKMTSGDEDGDGMFPWVTEKLEELGAETPVLFDETDGIDFEAVAGTNPDVILAAYSWITEEEYETLSKIAPVVAFPGLPYATTMNETIELNAKALGLEDEGQELIDDLQTHSEEALAELPALQDQRVLFAAADPSDFSKLSVFTLPDSRPGFLLDLGLPQPAIMDELAEENVTFFSEVSAEQAERFDDVDVFAMYGTPDGSFLKSLQADPILSKVPAIAAGRLAILEEDTAVAMLANPSPLGVPWGIDQYLSILAEAAAIGR